MAEMLCMFVDSAGPIPLTTSAITQQSSALVLSTTCRGSSFIFWKEFYAIMKIMLSTYFFVFWRKSSSFSEGSSLRSLKNIRSCLFYSLYYCTLIVSVELSRLTPNGEIK